MDNHTLLDETLLSLRLAAENFPGGPKSVQTLRNFCMRGVRGVKLESIKLGGRRATSREAIVRFVNRVTEAANRN